MSNYWGGHVLMDQRDLERMFCQEDSWDHLPTVWDEPQEETLECLEEVRPLLDKIPSREADFIELYYFKKMRQMAIAELFNVSQPTVCYRLRKGAARLKYLLSLPEYDPAKMERDLQRVVRDDTDVQILMGMAETTCQSEVARNLNATQGFVRYRFLRALTLLEQRSDMAVYVELFQKVTENLNIMTHICRAEWDEEVIYSIA
jgi:predicted DNA-binding protein YlxM (UPF0122 family)